MALKIKTLKELEPTARKVVPGMRLCLTADDPPQLVEPTDPRAASLYCNATKAVDRDEFRKLLAASKVMIEDEVVTDDAASSKSRKDQTQNKDRSDKRSDKGKAGE